jgi:hypothetical protein
MYLSNKINNISTICSPRHVHISDVHVMSHDHSNQPVPSTAVRVRTIPVVLRSVVVWAKQGKYSC